MTNKRDSIAHRACSYLSQWRNDDLDERTESEVLADFVLRDQARAEQPLQDCIHQIRYAAVESDPGRATHFTEIANALQTQLDAATDDELKDVIEGARLCARGERKLFLYAMTPSRATLLLRALGFPL